MSNRIEPWMLELMKQYRSTGEKSGIPQIDAAIADHIENSTRMATEAEKAAAGLPIKGSPSGTRMATEAEKRSLELLKQAKKGRLSELANKFKGFGKGAASLVGPAALAAAALGSGDVEAAISGSEMIDPSQERSLQDLIPAGSEEGGGRIMREDDRAMDRKIEALQRMLKGE